MRYPTSGAMVGAIWKPLAPAPIMATRRPARSTVWSHRAEWKAGPANSSCPGMSGTLGRLSWPTAEISARASRVSTSPFGPRIRTDQVARSSSHDAPSASVSNRMCCSIPCRVMTVSK